MLQVANTRWNKGIALARRRPPLAAALAAAYLFGSGITITGSGVSQWDDRSGNGRHLVQATDASRPLVQTDGSILFDGVAHNLQSAGFVIAQPWTAYFLGRQVTWTVNDSLFDIGANAGAIATVWQNTATPSLALSAGAALIGQGNLAVNTLGIVCAVGNGVASATQVNQTAAVTGDGGTNAVGRVTIGARADVAFFGNVRVLEFLVYSGAHSLADRLNVMRYLAALGGVAL